MSNPGLDRGRGKKWNLYGRLVKIPEVVKFQVCTEGTLVNVLILRKHNSGMKG